MRWVLPKNGGLEDRVRNMIMCGWIDEEERMLSSLNDKMMSLKLKGWFYEDSHVVYLYELECWAIDNKTEWRVKFFAEMKMVEIAMETLKKCSLVVPN